MTAEWQSPDDRLEDLERRVKDIEDWIAGFTEHSRQKSIRLREILGLPAQGDEQESP